jgi:hypothetical protein
LAEDLGEHQQEERAEEVDSSNGDVETVGLLVHPWAENRDTNEKTELDQDKSDSLGLAAALSETDEHGLDEQVSEPWNDEPVSGSLKLDVEETPLVESNGVRVEDVGRVLVHGNGALRNANDLGRGPRKYADHGENGQNGENDETSGVALSKLPEAKHHHLRETDEDNTEENTLQHCLPSIAEVNELVALHLASLHKTFTDVLESKHANDGEEDEDDEECVSREEDVGRLDASLETNTLNSVEPELLRAKIRLLTPAVKSSARFAILIFCTSTEVVES